MTDAGTDLYRRTLAFDYGDADRADLMRKVWECTPWMTDAYTGSPDDRRNRAMIEWCTDAFGPEAWPIHERPGRWQRGHATVYGWTWFGFATEQQLAAFIACWPAPEGIVRP